MNAAKAESLRLTDEAVRLIGTLPSRIYASGHAYIVALDLSDMGLVKLSDREVRNGRASYLVTEVV